MHIDQQRITQPLSQVELAHLQHCPQCSQFLQLQQQLQQAAVDLPLLTVPSQSWQAIKSATRSTPAIVHRNSSINKKQPWTLITGLAATLLLTIAGGLMWHNHQLQTELVQVLQLNQALELQLNQTNLPNYRQSQLLIEVKGVEQALNDSQSIHHKVQLLQQRQQLIQAMIDAQSGAANEFSI